MASIRDCHKYICIGLSLIERSEECPRLVRLAFLTLATSADQAALLLSQSLVCLESEHNEDKKVAFRNSLSLNEGSMHAYYLLRRNTIFSAVFS